MVCLIKRFPREWKGAAACGMRQLITNSEPPFSLRLLSFFFLVASLSSMMACFVVFCALEGSSEETEQESSLGIFHSHSDPRVSVSSLQITLFMESLSLFCYLSLSCQSLQRPGLLHVSIHITGMWAPFKAVLHWCAFTDCISAYCILKIPHFLENAAFEDENIILTEAHYIKGKKRWERKGKRNEGNKDKCTKRMIR